MKLLAISRCPPAQPVKNAPKMSVPDAFTGERGKLPAFLAKLELYIGFNQAEMDKGLFATSFLKDAAFDWVDPNLHEFLDKTPHERNADKESIFGNYRKFKEEPQRAFGVVDEKRTAERRIHVLRLERSAAVYSAEFQRIAALTEWDDEALT